MQIPAVLVVGALAVAGFGAVPRASAALGWAALVGALVVGQLGAILDLPQAALNLSPFTHAPGVPAAEFRLVPLVLLLAVAVALVAGRSASTGATEESSNARCRRAGRRVAGASSVA